MNTKRYLSANFSWMCFTALMLLLAIPVRIQGVEYRFEIIAQPGDVIEGRTIIGSSNEFNPVDINNHREVAFSSKVAWDGVEGFGVMTQDRFLAGAGKEVDGVIPFIDDESAWLEINDAGTVVYTADIPGIRFSSVFANDNVVYKTGDVVDGETLFGISPIPTINNHGDIVIVASLAGSRAVIRNDEIVVRGGRDLIGGFELDDLFWPRVSETGQTVFFTFLRDEPIETGLAGAAYNAARDRFYTFDDNGNDTRATNFYEYDRNGVRTGGPYQGSGFLDLEGITHLSGDQYAVIEEKDRLVGEGEEFHITTITLPPSGGSFTKANPLRVSHPLLTETPGNNAGAEGIALDSGIDGDPTTTSDNYFYVVKEYTSNNGPGLVFRVPQEGDGNNSAAATLVSIPNLPSVLMANPANPNSPQDISDVFFTRLPSGNGRLFLLNDEGSQVVQVDLDGTGIAGTASTTTLDIGALNYEGITFTTAGIQMLLVSDEGGSGPRFQRYLFEPDAPTLSSTGPLEVDVEAPAGAYIRLFANGTEVDQLDLSAGMTTGTFELDTLGTGMTHNFTITVADTQASTIQSAMSATLMTMTMTSSMPTGINT